MPPPVAPAAPTNVKAITGPGQIRITWEAPLTSSVRFNIYRSNAAGGTFRKLNILPILGSEFTDVGLSSDDRYAYIVRSVNRRGKESTDSRRLIASALPERKEPVFTAALKENLSAEFIDSIVLEGTARGSAEVRDGALALRDNAYVTYPYKNEFDLRGRLSVECRLYLKNVEQMPVIISCGQWRDKGWFLQKLGGSWRWHLGGIDCDGGMVPAGQWVHLVGTYDGKKARLFQNGKQVASVPCHPNKTAWKGPLFIGQYGAGPGPQYQVKGKIATVKIYRRALTAEEVTKSIEAGQ